MPGTEFSVSGNQTLYHTSAVQGAGPSQTKCNLNVVSYKIMLIVTDSDDIPTVENVVHGIRGTHDILLTLHISVISNTS